MGDKDKEKSVHHDDKQKKSEDVDTDAEHNKDTSRKSSNADLKKHAHGAAESSSYGSVQSSMNLLSRQFYDGTVRLKELIHSNTTGDAGAEPAIQEIHQLYETTMDQADRVRALISTVNKGDAHTLAAEIKKTQGTGFMFVTHMHRAASWIKEQAGHEQDERLDEQKIWNVVNDYGPAVGIDGEMDQDRHAPEGDEMTLVKQVVGDEVDALESAINSVSAGNSDDLNRIILHARTLDNFAIEHHLGLKTAHNRLLEMKKTFDKVRSQNDDARLGEASNHINQLISRHG